jgi:hypothetical protein
MSDEMYIHDLASGAQELCRFKAASPDHESMFFVNTRGMRNKPLWRVEGKRNWQRLKRYHNELQIVVLGPDGQQIDIDLRGFRRKPSDEVRGDLFRA